METAYSAAFARIEAGIKAMHAMKIDVQVVSIVATQYYYWAERDAIRGGNAARLLNLHAD